MAEGKVDVLIRVKNERALSRVEQKFKSLDATADKLNSALGSKLPGSFNKLGSAAGGSSAKLASFAKAGGLVAAAVVAVGVAVQQTASKFAAFANDLNKSRQALASIAGGGTTQAIAAIDETVERFGGTVQDATKNFTGLTAAVQATGGTVKDTETVFKGLTAANVALGGSSEDLNGILLAAQQIFSKGKVSAEELRGQIGERLPGAFNQFAEATGRSTAELDKALQRGEVSVEEFVLFAEGLFEKYEEDAEALYRGPNNATERLKDGLNKFNTQLGILLKPIDDAFKNLFNGILEVASKFVQSLNNLFGLGAEGAFNKANREFEAALDNYNRFQKLVDEGKGGQRNVQNLKRAKAELDAARQALQDVQAANRTRLQVGEATPVESNFQSAAPDAGGGGSGTGTTTRSPRQVKVPIEKLVTDEQLVLLEKLQKLKLNDNKQQIIEAKAAGNSELVKELEAARKLIPLIEEIAVLKRAVFQADAFKAKELERGVALEEIEKQILGVQNQLTLRQQDLETARLENQEAQVELEAAQAKAREDALRPLIEQKQLLEAKLAGNEEEVRLQLESEKIARGVTGLQAEEVKGILETNKALEEKVKLQEEAKRRTEEIAEGIASGITGALSDVLKQTKTMEEAFADTLKNIGDMFIDMAMEVLQNALIQQLIRIIPSLIPSTAPVPGGGMFPLGQGFKFSGGGYTGDGPRSGGLDGEGGFMAMLHPQETVIDHTKMDAYGPSREGGSSAPISINYSGPRLNFNQEEYLPVSAVPGLIKEAAAAGERRTLSKMRNSPTTRKRVGI